MEQNGSLTGFSTELWNEAAARLDVKTSYQLMPDVKAFFESLRSRNADIAVSGLFYTSERDREFDFSYPIMEVGLQVMVRDASGTAAPDALRDLLKLVFRARRLSGSRARANALARSLREFLACVRAFLRQRYAAPTEWLSSIARAKLGYRVWLNHLPDRPS
jgi:ABC-type amino acid transport substrate-binding protein